MRRRKILMVSSVYWNSPFQVGDHHLARNFVQSGWDVAHISTPISPLHLLTGNIPDLKDRFAIYKSGGIRDMDGHIWSYVPGAFFVPHNRRLLRSKWVYHNWQRFTCPNLVKTIAQNGFTEVDILYFSDPKQSFLLNVIKHKMSLYRIADKHSGFLSYNNELEKLDRLLAKSVDLVIYSAQNLRNHVNTMAPKRVLYLPNGVNFSHFARGDYRIPDEYKNLQRPIIVYVGAIDFWFDFDLIDFAAKSLPWMSFVLIGPDKLARERLGYRPNLPILGSRSYSKIPSYLHYADVGIIPFNTSKYPELVNSINPLKLYEYMACGLPVVAAEWEELKNIRSPAVLCHSREEFVQKVKDAVSVRHDKSVYMNYARSHDWGRRFEILEDVINKSI